MAEKNIGDLKGRISLENSDFKEKMSQARKELNETANSSKNLSRDFGNIQMASLAVGAAVVAGIGASVKVAADFEAQMSRVKAISGATDEEFKKLEASALDLGASTTKSASEVAKGMEDMAAMGFNVNEVIAAMPGVISAAEASGTDLAATSKVVAAALNSFQMEASEANKVADILAKTANVSSASVEDMGYAFKYAAPVANVLGISMEELAAATGIMTDAGLEGSQAGTTLRMALLRLANAPEEASVTLGKLGVEVTDAQGNFLSLAEILPQFEKGLEGMGNAQKTAALSTIFGAEAVSGMVALIDGGTPKFEEFTEALENSGGSAKEAADIMMDNLKGSLDSLGGSIETVGIQLGKEFLPLFKDIVDAGADIVRKFGEVDTKTVKTTLAFVGITAAVALVLSTIGKLSMALTAFAMTPVGAAILGLSLLAGVIGAVVVSQQGATEVTLDHANALIEEKKSLDANVTSYETLKNKMTLTNDQLDRFVDINSQIKQTADPAVITALKDEQAKLMKESGLTNDELTTFLGLNDTLIATVPQASTRITEEGNAMLNTAGAAKELSKEKSRLVQLELEAQYANAINNEEANLEKRKKLLQEINDASEDKIKWVAMEQEHLGLLAAAELAYAEAKKNGNFLEIADAKLLVANEKAKVDLMKQYQADEANLLVSKQEELDKINAAIGKLDTVKYKLIEVQLAQVGLNAKKGEELSAIDLATTKLIQQRRELELNTPVNKKNTDEYQEAVGAIDRQIQALGTARGKIVDLTIQATGLNAALGKVVVKDVIIRTVGGQSLKRLPDLERHSGGLVDLPKLHSGGSSNQLMDNLRNAPQHNEVDVRLLKNEAVFTESQQANLMRMIDAGHTGTNGNSMEETNSLLREIAEGLAEGKDISIVMNERVVGTIVEEHVTRAQKRKEEVNSVFNGKRW